MLSLDRQERNSPTKPFGFFAFLYFIALFGLASCSFTSSVEIPTRAQEAKQRALENPATDVSVEPFTSRESSEALQSREGQPEFGVVLTWDIPAEPVEAFVLYVGNSPDRLSTEIHLAVSDLQIVGGNKYRYLVKPVVKGESLYVALAAKSNGEISPKSAVQKIEAETSEVSRIP